VNRLRKNEIDGPTLLTLTNRELRDLGFSFGAAKGFSYKLEQLKSSLARSLPSAHQIIFDTQKTYKTYVSL
jgi:hypothetical protein